ncbi:MAG: hypothetical protein AB7S38_22410 [Vulcanimicrobiota bacterium]
MEAGGVGGGSGAGRSTETRTSQSAGTGQTGQTEQTGQTGQAGTSESHESNRSEPTDQVSLSGAAEAEADQPGSHADAVTNALSEDPRDPEAPQDDKDDQLSPEDTQRVEDYHALAQQQETLVQTIQHDIDTNNYGLGSMGPTNLEKFSAVNQQIESIRDNFDQALAGVEDQAAAVQAQAAAKAELEGTTAQLMSPEERQNLIDKDNQKLEQVAAPMDAATQKMIKEMNDPVFKENFQDWDPVRQADFYSDMARTMGYTPTGQQWAGDLVDGLASLGRGQDTNNVYSQVAQELSTSLTGQRKDALDDSLGLLAGIDRAGRPQGADQRLAAAGEALGVPKDQLDSFIQNLDPSSPASLPSAPGALYGGGRFTNAAALAYNAFQTGNGQGSPDVLAGASNLADLASGTASLANFGGQLSRLGQFANGASRLSGYLSIGSGVYQATQGNWAGVPGPIMGGAGGLIGANPVGLTLMGAGMAAGPLLDQADYADYAYNQVSGALGAEPFDSLRGTALATADQSGVNLMDRARPADMSLPEFFNQELARYDGTYIGTDFWQYEGAYLRGLLETQQGL